MGNGKQNGSLVLAAGLLGLGIIVQGLIRRLTALDLLGQVVFITGSSRGLGFILAQEFARRGARLVICARKEEELEQAHQELVRQGAEVLALSCDVSNPEQVKQVVDQATRHYGRIDILVNNAGIITVGPLMAQTLKDFEDSMNIMYWGIVHTTMAVLPQMLERKSGRIVNITSIGGKVSVPHLLPYDSAKFAAVGFSEGLHAELAQEGIKVVTVAPGLMRTGSQLNAYFKGKNHEEYTWFTLLGSIPPMSMDARRAARQIVRATQLGKAEVVLSFPAKLMAKFHGLFPGVTADMLGLMNRFLPTADPLEGLDRKTGKESQTPISTSFLTALSQKAAREYNE
jgi:short-subunit dehydrogenase